MLFMDTREHYRTNNGTDLMSVGFVVCFFFPFNMFVMFVLVHHQYLFTSVCVYICVEKRLNSCTRRVFSELTSQLLRTSSSLQVCRMNTCHLFPYYICHLGRSTKHKSTKYTKVQSTKYKAHFFRCRECAWICVVKM